MGVPEQVDDVEWSEPPTPRNGRGVHEALFDALRRNPGQWAVFVKGVKSPGGYFDRLKSGRYRGIEAGELEVTTHKVGPRNFTVFVRVKDEEGNA